MRVNESCLALGLQEPKRVGENCRKLTRSDEQCRESTRIYDREGELPRLNEGQRE